LTLTLGSRISSEGSSADAVRQYGDRDQTSSRYTLFSREKHAVVGTAESAIVVSDISAGVFRGVRTVETSADGSQILLNEEVSDASPMTRYILFKRQVDGAYKTVYLAPPEIKDPTIMEFGFYLPRIHLRDKGFDAIPELDVPFTRF